MKQSYENPFVKETSLVESIVTTSPTTTTVTGDNDQKYDSTWSELE